jgi:histidinol-phosphate aminotransferase
LAICTKALCTCACSIEQAITEVGRYPDGNGFELKQSIAKYLSISSEHITLGNGSNDILELLARISLCHMTELGTFDKNA